MTRSLNLTRAGEHALAALPRLAPTDGGRTPLPVAGLARAQRIPKACLAKIVQRCSRAGPGRAADDISLLGIVAACEGPCRREEESLPERLDRITLTEMARALSVHPDAGGAAFTDSGGIEWTRD